MIGNSLLATQFLPINLIDLPEHSRNLQFNHFKREYWRDTTSDSDSELELSVNSTALVLDILLRSVLIFLLTLHRSPQNFNKPRKYKLLFYPLLLPLNDLLVDGYFHGERLLDLHQLLVVRSQAVDLPVEEAHLTLLRLDLKRRRETLSGYKLRPT